MNKYLAAFFLAIFIAASAAETAHAAWVWSPDLGKWINPKKSAKDTPEEQYSWAMEFFNQNQWDRAIEEFEKLPAVFPTSRLAAEGVYHAGIAWEKKGDLAKAADQFQKLIDKYPYSDRIKDAVKREFDIANEFASGARMKVLGIPVLSGQEKALELYKHIVKNAPFGSYGDHAQFKIGEVYKMQGEFDLAQKAFQAVVDEYPSSELISQARYQIAYCSMQASKAGQYNEESADRAIEEFEGFKKAYPSNEQALEADESIKAIRAQKAKVSFENAEFYDKRKKLASAKVYYQEVATQFPETRYAERARRRLDEIAASESEPKSKPRFRLW
jgi:outer membrane assembly lipoprotein YfiO